MPGRFRMPAVLVLAAAFAALPLASSADDPAPAPGSVRLKFAAPKGWTDDTRPTGRAGVWRSWVVRDAGVVESIVLSVTHESRTAGPYVEATIAYLKTAANVTVMDFGPATTCGNVPAFTYTYRSDRTPPDEPDRADALSTLCDAEAMTATPAPAASQAPAR
jgi:hypothetical protein